MEDNNDNVSDRVLINTFLYRRLYFCPHFYKAYRGREKIHNCFARFDRHKGIFTCQECFVQLKEYITPNKPEFFSEIRKMLIEYFISLSESTHQMGHQMVVSIR